MAEYDPGFEAVSRTDRLIDALAAGAQMPPADPLASMLAGWRDEVRSRPEGRPVSMSQAAAALKRAQTQAEQARQRTRFGMTVLGAVAASLLCLGGLGAVIYGAGPGDPMYGLRTMLFGESPQVRDERVALAAQTQLAEVQQLIDQGQWEQAHTKLAAISSTVQTVQDTERKEELIEQWNQLTVKVVERNPEATLPPEAPPPVLPPPPPVLTVPPSVLFPLPEVTAATTTTTAEPTTTTTAPTTGPTTTTTPSTTTATSEPQGPSPTTRTTQPTSAPPATTSAPRATTSAPPASTPAPSPVTSAPPATTSAPPATTSAARAATSAPPATTPTPPASTPVTPQVTTTAAPTHAITTTTVAQPSPAGQASPAEQQPAEQPRRAEAPTTTEMPSDSE